MQLKIGFPYAVWPSCPHRMTPRPSCAAIGRGGGQVLRKEREGGGSGMEVWIMAVREEEGGRKEGRVEEGGWEGGRTREGGRVGGRERESSRE